MPLYYIPFVSTVDVTYRGYDLKTSPDLWQQAADALGNVPMTEELLAEIDPRTLPVIEDAEAVELQLKGKVYRYLFRDTYFQGSLFSEDYLYRSSDPYPILFVAPITGAIETITPTNGMMRPTVNDGTPICFAAVNGTPGSGKESLIFGLGGTHIDLDTVSPEETDVNRLIVLPAETVEDASALFWDTLWRRYQEDYLDFLARQRETESQ